ncbi:Protein of unknown function, partial [Cotesia congregata]
MAGSLVTFARSVGFALAIGTTDAIYQDPRTRNQQFTGQATKDETNGADDLVRVTRDAETPKAPAVADIRDSQTHQEKTLNKRQIGPFAVPAFPPVFLPNKLQENVIVGLKTPDNL